ncbi:MAG: Gfo/Idh/MocA family oxidoreductase [Asgard group archaeon]|nr:Gfo/Idh/MocA family oxidoreductase [Asgard group archaeon]
MKKKAVTAIVIGAGDRGADVYANYALRFPDEMKVVAVAEPIEERRNLVKVKHNLKEDRCFSSWEKILAEQKLADLAIVATQDQMHAEPAILAMRKGYDVLLEKPMANTIDDCKELVEVSKETGKLLQICHVLRYAPYFSQLKSVIESGRIGDIVNISWRENVSYWHYSHSYIRGNWHNRDESSPMILAKSCHDMDLLFWLIRSPTKKIHSFGNQTHFGRFNQPEGAPDRCLDGCPVSESCLYYAPRLYLDLVPLIHMHKKAGSISEKLFSSLVLRYPNLTQIPPFKKVKEYTGWPISVISKDLSYEGRIKALQETNYGKCVYAIDDHNIVDHQIVNIEFDNKVTASFTMHGFSDEEGRSFRIDGTKGTIKGDYFFSKQIISIIDVLTGKEEQIGTEKIDMAHGGGDDVIMKVFLKSVRFREKEDILTTASNALESHLMAFAADISRVEERIVEMKELR